MLATTLQEEMIIFALIERAQFGANAKVTAEMRIHLRRPLDSTILYMHIFLAVQSYTLRLLDMRSSLWLAAFRKRSMNVAAALSSRRAVTKPRSSLAAFLTL